MQRPCYDEHHFPPDLQNTSLQINKTISPRHGTMPAGDLQRAYACGFRLEAFASDSLGLYYFVVLSRGGLDHRDCLFGVVL